MTNNTIQLSDLKFDVRGRMFAYFNQVRELEWCIEMMSITEEPFSVYIMAMPFKELNDSNFDLCIPEFSHEITEYRVLPSAQVVTCILLIRSM